MSEKLLEVKNLNVRYAVERGYAYAVNGISFSMKPKEAVGLVGETGAGKTTTALGILRLLPKAVSEMEGEVLFRGQDISKVSEKEMRDIRGKEISMIFQDPMTSLNPVFTVGDQIADVLKIHNEKMPAAEVENRVNEMLEMVGIPADRKKEYPHQFSGGMKQRIMIAIALACRPKILIADEPTSALDVTIQAQVMGMMKNLQEEVGSAVLLITHDFGIVASFCDSVAIMYGGEIVEYGSVYEIFDKSREHHPYTKGLFDSIPDIHTKAARLNPIPGLTPHPTELPPGCKFHPRCRRCQEICKAGEVPVIKNGNHQIRCHMAGKKREV